MRWQPALVSAALLSMAGCADAGNDPVDIDEPTVAEVIVSPAESTVSVGASVRLTASPLDAAGNEVPDARVTWSSSNPNVASVTYNGLVMAVGTGAATLTASCGSVSGTASMIVESVVAGVLHGLTWTIEMNGTGLAPLHGVWGTSQNDVFVVGGNQPGDCCGMIAHNDGIGWSYGPAWEAGPSGSLALEVLRDVWGSSGSDVFLVGGAFLDFGTILHWDGAKWTRGAAATDILEAVWGSSADDVFAVGMWNVIVHYDGKTWSEMPVATDLDSWSFVDVWGSSGSDVFAVGQSGTIVHYDGSTWTRMQSPTGLDLAGVWGSSGTSVFAVGNVGVILHYDGTTWSEMTSPTAHSIRAVWGNSESDVFAVGDRASILHYDGTSWSGVEGPTGQALFDVWGSPGHVFVVGAGPTILHGRL